MASQDDNAPLESRPATPDDLIFLCRLFNEHEVRYVIIGGMAMIQHGLMRLTSDIDVLVDSGEENMQRIRSAMQMLPDGAILEVQPGDVRQYGVVRVADEFVTDLMHAACGIEYDHAIKDAEICEIEGISIPIASRRILWLSKRTDREKDALDRNFLKALMEERGERLPLTPNT